MPSCNTHWCSSSSGSHSYGWQWKFTVANSRCLCMMLISRIPEYFLWATSLYIYMYVPLSPTKTKYTMLYWSVYFWLLPLSLHVHICSYDEALSDFEAAIRLQRSLPSPYVCAGLIHLLQRDNSPRATRCFSAALAVDPTCLRAYLCRAEALKKDGKVAYWK